MVHVRFRYESNQPVGLEIDLPDWTNGGVRQVVDISLWEALQLQKLLARALDPNRITR